MFVAAVFVPRSLRELQRMKEAEMLSEWRRAPSVRTGAIRKAWRDGTAVTDTDDAALALAMSDHVDRVIAATNRVSFWACAPIAPGLVLMLASLSRTVLVVAVAVVVFWFAFHLVAMRSRKRRHRSMNLTRQQSAVQY
jgi:hypothetical protein